MIRVLKILYAKRAKLRSLSFADQCMMVKASVLLIILRTLSAFMRTPNLVSWVDRMLPEPKANNKDQKEIADSIHRAVEIAGNILFNAPSCLPKALAARILLGRRGIQTKLFIGVIMRDNKMSGHAWLKMNDQVIMGDTPHLNLYHIIPIPEHFR